MPFAGLAKGLKSLSLKEPASYAIGIGIIGLITLACLIIIGLGDALHRVADPACAIKTLQPIAPIDALANGIEITGVMPINLERSHTLCVGVANVVAEEKVDRLTGEDKFATLVASAAVKKLSLLSNASRGLSTNPSLQAQTNAELADADGTHTLRAAGDLCGESCAGGLSGGLPVPGQ